MTWLAGRLRERAQVLVAVQTPSDDGGFDRGYRRLGTLWAELKEASYRTNMAAYIRGVNVEDSPTHEITIRRVAVTGINAPAFGIGFGPGAYTPDTGGYGREFSQAWGMGFNSIVDLSPVKSRWFVLIERGTWYRGRLFRILGVQDAGERREYLKVKVKEIEEWGTGYPE